MVERQISSTWQKVTQFTQRIRSVKESEELDNSTSLYITEKFREFFLS
jgi:hypothetical protein